MKYGIDYYNINKETGKETDHVIIEKYNTHKEGMEEISKIRHMFSHTNEILINSGEKVSFYMDDSLIVYQLVRLEKEG